MLPVVLCESVVPWFTSGVLELPCEVVPVLWLVLPIGFAELSGAPAVPAPAPLVALLLPDVVELCPELVD